MISTATIATIAINTATIMACFFWVFLVRCFLEAHTKQCDAQVQIMQELEASRSMSANTQMDENMVRAERKKVSARAEILQELEMSVHTDLAVFRLFGYQRLISIGEEYASGRVRMRESMNGGM